MGELVFSPELEMLAQQAGNSQVPMLPVWGRIVSLRNLRHSPPTMEGHVLTSTATDFISVVESV